MLDSANSTSLRIELSKFSDDKLCHQYKVQCWTMNHRLSYCHRLLFIIYAPWSPNFQKVRTCCNYNGCNKINRKYRNWSKWIFILFYCFYNYMSWIVISWNCLMMRKIGYNDTSVGFQNFHSRRHDYSGISNCHESWS